jgi:pimeloyl-ACP methyl ester carboxylesterase
MRADTGDLGYLRKPPAPREPSFWQSPAGRRLAWTEYGDPAGRPLIYCHGWPSSRLQAALLDQAARERGLRVLAIDRPGMGRSDRQAGRALRDWPPLLAAFADAQGIVDFLQLGVSGGGPYVLACAAMLPERVAASAVLCGAVPLAGGMRRGLHPVYRLLIPLRHLPHAWFTPGLRIAARSAAGPPDKPPVSWLLATLPRPDRELLMQNREALQVIAGSFSEGVRQGGRCVMEDAAIYLHDWQLPLDRIARPIRYWHGGADRHISAGLARAFVSGIPHARLDVDPGEGHFSLAVHRMCDALDHLAAAG